MSTIICVGGIACILPHDGRYVFVAGGDGDDFKITKKSSEYFDLETLTWHEGPSVDTYDFYLYRNMLPPSRYIFS